MANSGTALAIIIFGSEASPIIFHFAFCILHLKKPLPRNTGQRLTLLTTHNYKRTIIRRPFNGGHRRGLLRFSPLLGSDFRHPRFISGSHRPRLAYFRYGATVSVKAFSYGRYNITKKVNLQVFYYFYM